MLILWKDSPDVRRGGPICYLGDAIAPSQILKIAVTIPKKLFDPHNKIILYAGSCSNIT